MERNIPVIPIFRNFRPTSRGSPQNLRIKFVKVSVSFALPPGIFGNFWWNGKCPQTSKISVQDLTNRARVSEIQNGCLKDKKKPLDKGSLIFYSSPKGKWGFPVCPCQSWCRDFANFCKVANIFVKAPEVTWFWRRKASFEPLKSELLGGSGDMLPQEIDQKKRTLDQKRSFQSFWKPSISFQGKVAIHSNSL